MAKPDGGIDWLRYEFHLDDAQFAKVKALHESYVTKCDFMCQRIAQSNTQLDQLVRANQTLTPEVKEAFRQSAEVQAECQQALLQHVLEVGAEMSTEDGARYMQMMKDRIIQPGLAHHSVVSER